jgi:hypothetical protein
MLDHQRTTVVRFLTPESGSEGERLQDSQPKFSQKAPGSRSDAF